MASPHAVSGRLARRTLDNALVRGVMDRTLSEARLLREWSRRLRNQSESLKATSRALMKESEAIYLGEAATRGGGLISQVDPPSQVTNPPAWPNSTERGTGGTLKGKGRLHARPYSRTN